MRILTSEASPAMGVVILDKWRLSVRSFWQSLELVIDRSGCNIAAHRTSVTDASCSTFCCCNIGTSFRRLACPVALCSTLISHRVALEGMDHPATEPLRRLSIFRSGRVISLRRGDLLARIKSDVDGSAILCEVILPQVSQRL